MNFPSGINISRDSLNVIDLLLIFGSASLLVAVVIVLHFLP